MNLRVLSAFLILITLVGATALPARGAEPQEVDRIVAVVGEEVITLHELRGRLASVIAQLKQQGTPLPSDDVLEKQMLERLIVDRAQIQMARESGIRIDDSQLDAVFELLGNAARTGKIGDGKIWATPVTQVMRVRTSEMGPDAL